MRRTVEKNQTQSGPPYPGEERPFPWLDIAASVTAAIAGWFVAGAVMKKPTAGSQITKVLVASIAGIAMHSLVVAQTATKVVTGALKSAFRGFSKHFLPTPERRSQFLAQAKTMAGRKQHQLSAWKSIVDELKDKGLEREAALLEKHLAKHGHEPFYQAMENWLQQLAVQSPETLQHIQRQAVAIALTVEAFGKDMPQQARDALMVKALVAGAAHDIGKLSIDPELLHKAHRIDHALLEIALGQYQQLVPDYPGKALDMEFLRMLNGGRIPFDSAAEGKDVYSVSDIIAQVNNAPLLGEPDFASPELKFSCKAHYENIKQKALSCGCGWLPAEQERALLNTNRRGTLTPEEGQVMAVHDKLGVDMLQQVGMPPELGLDVSVVDMSRYGKAALTGKPDQEQIRQIIELSDQFEAVTGQRAYNRENGKNLTVKEATQVLDKHAEHGLIDKTTVGQFKAAGVAEKYDALYRDIPKGRAEPQPVLKGAATTEEQGKIKEQQKQLAATAQ